MSVRVHWQMTRDYNNCAGLSLTLRTSVEITLKEG